MRALAPLLRATAFACAIATAAAPFGTQQAGAQGRYPRIDMLDAGDLGGEPRRPALAGGVWAEDPLIVGVEPELDRTFLFRLGWLGPDSLADTPVGAEGVAGDSTAPGAAREFAEAQAEGRPGAAALPEGDRVPLVGADLAPAKGRPIHSPGGPGAGAPGVVGAPGSAHPAPGIPGVPGASGIPGTPGNPFAPGAPAVPSLPEILAFPPLPPDVLEMAVGGSGTENLVVWAAAEGPTEAPNIRLSARRIGRDGAPAGPDLTLQIGPGRPADLAVAVAPDGEAIVAWSNHLAGRGAGLRWRAIGRSDALGSLRMDWDIASDQGSPSVVAIPGGFALAHLRTTLEGQPPATERSVERPADASPDAELAPEAPVPGREIRLRRLGSSGVTRGEVAVVAARKGLDHPCVAARSGAVSVFWTDPRGGGRVLRIRSYGTDGSPLGSEGSLRTDLRPSESPPYRVAPAGEGYWLVIWPQQEGRGRSMVLETRLFHSSGNAAGPPLLVARSSGAIALRDLFGSRGFDRWVALWTEEEAGQYRLRYRPLRRDTKG